jgi:hypothetical protein
MTTFTYKEKRVMDRLPGKNYSTTYIKQELAEKKRMQRWVEDACLQVKNLSVENNCEHLLNEPLANAKHKHKDGERYTIWESLTDLRDQLRAGKDVPESMITRWNEAFVDNEEMQIFMQEATPRGNSRPPIDNTFNTLFV